MFNSLEWSGEESASPQPSEGLWRKFNSSRASGALQRKVSCSRVSGIKNFLQAYTDVRVLNLREQTTTQSIDQATDSFHADDITIYGIQVLLK